VKYTVKVTESYWFYDVEADDLAGAKQIIANTGHEDQWNDANDYNMSIEGEEASDY
jgi:hypothetical protein